MFVLSPYSQNRMLKCGYGMVGIQLFLACLHLKHSTKYNNTPIQNINALSSETSLGAGEPHPKIMLYIILINGKQLRGQ